jgi:hypothetical protein
MLLNSDTSIDLPPVIKCKECTAASSFSFLIIALHVRNNIFHEQNFSKCASNTRRAHFTREYCASRSKVEKLKNPHNNGEKDRLANTLNEKDNFRQITAI